MASSPHNDPIQSSDLVLIVTIDNGNLKSYLLANLEHSGFGILPIRSCSTICDRCSTILNIEP
jgi:hypothetical protein